MARGGDDKPAKVSRPVVRWYGGKWILAPWIVSHFPRHRTYVEAFGGGGSVLLRKPRAVEEIYNDLDGCVVNLFRVLRDPDKGAALARALYLTPFSREELNESYAPGGDDVERARRLVVRSYMGFGSNAHNAETKTGFRGNNRNGQPPAVDWRNFPDNIPAVVERLRGVAIESRDACEVMTKYDGENVLIYADPPYMRSTRNPRQGYRHDMVEADHVRLVECLRGLKAAVILSGYRTSLYDDALSDWRRVDRHANADGGRARLESLWLNARAVEDSGPLFRE